MIHQMRLSVVVVVLGTFPSKILRVARLAERSCPRKSFNTKRGWKNAEKSEKRCGTCPKSFWPLSWRLKIFHQHFHRPKLAQIEYYFFTARICRGGHSKKHSAPQTGRTISELQTRLNLHSPVSVGQMALITSERVQFWVCLFLSCLYCPGVGLRI